DVPGAAGARVAGGDVGAESVPVDQLPVQVPEGRTPELAGGVHLVVVVVIPEGVRVDCHVVAVGIAPDARAIGRLPQRVVGDWPGLVVGVGGALSEHQGPPVAPPLAHASALLGVQGIRVGGSAGQAVGDPVPVLVDNNVIVEVAVAVGEGVDEEIHLH